MNIPQSSIEPFGVIGMPYLHPDDRVMFSGNKVPVVRYTDNDYIADQLGRAAKEIFGTTKLGFGLGEMSNTLKKVAINSGASEAVCSISGTPGEKHYLFMMYTRVKGNWRRTPLRLFTNYRV